MESLDTAMLIWASCTNPYDDGDICYGALLGSLLAERN